MSEIKVPSTTKESVKWLLTLEEAVTNAQHDYKIALKAVAKRFDFSEADLKTAIKAVKDDKVKDVLSQLDSKRDVIEAVAH